MHAPKANPRLRGVRLLGMAQKLSGQLRHSQKDKMINIPLNSSNPNAENPHAACVSLIVSAFWQNVVDGMSYLFFCLGCPRFLILFRDSAQELVTGKGPCLQCANKCLHFSTSARHPCAGAMLIFSAPFQFYRMIAEGDPISMRSAKYVHKASTDAHRDSNSMLFEPRTK